MKKVIGGFFKVVFGILAVLLIAVIFYLLVLDAPGFSHFEPLLGKERTETIAKYLKIPGYETGEEKEAEETEEQTEARNPILIMETETEAETEEIDEEEIEEETEEQTEEETEEVKGRNTDYDVVVLNGTDRDGVAGACQKALVKEGFKNVGTGSAIPGSASNHTIFYLMDEDVTEEDIQELTDLFEGAEVRDQIDGGVVEDVSEFDNYEVIVLVGLDDADALVEAPTEEE